MKPHPRIRKTIKWGGAAVTVLLVVVWIGSGWGHVTWMYTGRGWVTVGGGRWTMGSFGPTNPVLLKSGFSVLRTPFQLKWSFDWREKLAGRTYITPLWLPIGSMLLITATAWHLDTLARRRAKLHLCPKCGYDRTGILRDAKCPECGAGR